MTAARLRPVAASLLIAVLLAGCTAGDSSPATERPAAGEVTTGPDAEDDGTADRPTASEPASPPSPSPTTPGSATAPGDTGSSPPARPAVRLRVGNVMRSVERLAGDIGPREATSATYARAARYVERSLGSWSYDVRRQHFSVPAGVSWGVEVPAGRSWNVVATPRGFTTARPFRIVGAHLDTVPQAPGAEDNASGVAVMLELARVASVRAPRIPVVFVAFGAEEPRGEGDALHHFGSQAMVARLQPAWRRSLIAMLSLDRVGVGQVVPVCSGGLEPPAVRRALLRAADRVGVPAESCLNQASDHWSFDKAGIAAARLGSTPYAEYHSEADLPGVVQPRQLRRVATVAWAWLR